MQFATIGRSPTSAWKTLRQFTAKLVEKRGWLSETEVDDFIDAGFSRAQVFEVILGIGLKTISNYINHIADTPLDKRFLPRASGNRRSNGRRVNQAGPRVSRPMS